MREVVVTAAGARRVPWRAVAVFLAVAFGASWLIEVVLAATGGLHSLRAAVGLVLMMFTPMIASLVVCRFVTRQPWSPAVGLGRATLRRRGWVRVLGFGLFAVAVLEAMTLAVMALAALLGWWHPDLAAPGLDAVLAKLPAGTRVPKAALLAGQLVNVVIAAFTVNALAALGEEAGWRGWLLGALAPLGRVRSLALVGVAWGLWHAPLIVMGYEYQHQVPAAAGIVLFTGFCVVLGVLLAWLRMRTGSVLTAAVGHGATNAVGSLPVFFVADPAGVPWARVGIMGVLGVLLFALLALVLMVFCRWAPREAA